LGRTRAVQCSLYTRSIKETSIVESVLEFLNYLWVLGTE
jgi:hypothetical protein